ncbi:PACE efflux transporter [Arsenicitalea aurantiaca]|uniref:PACE efflux transporter n=1 Tax=Arsenicitalea aurantiaca TaxID=1783274 RepID=A0A433XLU5_9HYPH|nr:PACE efflux transporter [Arsenicitalea aurantiaca]RUT35052.1 PACE efflux transporter [Arsenicitalea aurantiaca]
MRTVRDRIRHALSFEIIGLMLVTPLGAIAFHMPMHHIGVVSLVGATIATAWNYVYNWLFDHAMVRIAGTVRKTVAVRVLHAVLFELGLLAVLLPFIAWYLGISLIDALIMDIAFALFYMVYAFVFNWGYDRVFPLPVEEPASALGMESAVRAD